MKNIDYRFKLLYCLAIILVVAGHTQGGSIRLFENWFPLGGLHIMLFVFASGYFYQIESNENVLYYLIKKIKKFIIPLFIYNIFYGLFSNIMINRGFYLSTPLSLKSLFVDPIISGHQFGYNMGSWFIIPLLMCEIYNICLRFILKKTSIPEIAYWLFNTLLGIVGIGLAINGYNTGWYLVIVRFLFFLPFYAFGTFYKHTYEKYDLKIPNLVYFSIIIFIKLLISFFLLKMPYYTPSWCNDFVDGPLIPIINGLVGILFWFRICHILSSSIGKGKYINIIANHTYSIMMNQFLGFFLIKFIFSLISQYTPLFHDFDQNLYHTDIFYYYLPHGQEFMLIIYVCAGIIIPIFIDKIIDLLKEKTNKLLSSRK